MTSKTLGLALALAAITLAAPPAALAQYGGGSNPVGPTVSPYLNLLQQDADLNAPTNYQSLVRPLIEQGDAIRRQGSALGHLQQQVGGGGVGRGGGGGGRGTGHTTYFFNYLHYYPGASGR